LAGGKKYLQDHLGEMGDHVAAIESDSGCFAPRGFGVYCNDKAKQDRAEATLKELMTLMEPLEAREVFPGRGGADIGPMKDYGVVLMGHEVDESLYFDYHHTSADTLDKVDPFDVSRNTAMMATMAYVLAEMESRLGSE
jgi:hypothetical protein